MSWRASSILLIALFSGLLKAQTFSIPSKDFGRIFSDPNSRQRSERQEPVAAPVETVVIKNDTEVAISVQVDDPKSIALVLLGYAKQANGNVGLWLTQELDRRTYYLEVPNKDLNERSHHVTMVYQGVEVKLKPGQVFILDRSQVTELYAAFSEE